MTFSLWATETGGSAAAWSEGPVKVVVKGGQFSYAIGATAAIDITKIAALGAQWLGMKIGADPALPRQKVHASLFALWAGTAGGLTCTGCVTSDHIANGSIAGGKMGFNYAGSDTKGGPASDLKCTGCVSVAEMKFDADVDLGANSLKAKNGTFTGDVAAATVTSTSFIGDGSKLTGIKIPTGECKTTGEVVKGINADGTLKCVAALDPAALPADGLNEISNNLLTNQFVYTVAAPVKNLPIPDNTGSTADSVIDFPNIGTAQTLDVKVTVETSDLSHVSMVLLPPDDKKTGYTLCDPCGATDAKKLVATYNAKNPPKAQDGTGKKIAEWIGGNPQGSWTLKVLDDAYCVVQIPANKLLCPVGKNTDGWITDWSISMQYISNQKVAVNGDQENSGSVTVGKNVTVGGDLQISGNMTVGNVKAKYGMFQEFSVPYLFRYQSDFSSGNWVWDRLTRTNYAKDVKDDNEYLRSMNMELKFGTRAGNITQNHNWAGRYSSTNEGQMNIVLFIKNTTGKDIVHSICQRMSGRDNSPRRGSFSVNQTTIRDYTGNSPSSDACNNVTFPANKTSMLSLQCGGYYWTGDYATYRGAFMCHFYNSKLGNLKYTSAGLPAGLEFDYARYFDYVTY